jgi:hypothetical protein
MRLLPPPSLLMGYDTPPVIHAPTNVDASLSPQAWHIQVMSYDSHPANQ